MSDIYNLDTLVVLDLEMNSAGVVYSAAVSSRLHGDGFYTVTEGIQSCNNSGEMLRMGVRGTDVTLEELGGIFMKMMNEGSVFWAFGSAMENSFFETLGVPAHVHDL